MLIDEVAIENCLNTYCPKKMNKLNQKNIHVISVNITLKPQLICRYTYYPFMKALHIHGTIVNE